MANVIVQGVFVVDPGDRDSFIEASIEGMRTSRAEAGCLEYAFAPDPVDPGRIVLSERWESMEFLQAHLDAMHARPPVERPKPQSADVVMYEATVLRRLA